MSRYFGSRPSSRSSHDGSTGGSNPYQWRSSHHRSTGGPNSNQWRRGLTERERQPHFQIYEDPVEEQIGSGADINPLRPQQVAHGQENIFTPARPSPGIPGGRIPLEDITPERALLSGYALGDNATFRRPSLQALDIETHRLRDNSSNNNPNNMSSGQDRMRDRRTPITSHTSTPGPLIVLGPQTPIREVPHYPGASINPSIPRSSLAGGDGGSSLARQFQEALGPLNAERNRNPRPRYINSREVDLGNANFQRPRLRVVHRAPGSEYRQGNNASAHSNQEQRRNQSTRIAQEYLRSTYRSLIPQHQLPPGSHSSPSYHPRIASISWLEAGRTEYSIYYDYLNGYDTGFSTGGSSTYDSTADASDATDMEATNHLVCHLCTRREATLSFTACDHNICPSCMVGTWWGSINRSNHWPSSVSCPFCRAGITEIADAGSPMVELLYYICHKSGRARQKLKREKLELVHPPEMRAYLANMRVHYGFA